jgi:hypothetical protein
LTALCGGAPYWSAAHPLIEKTLFIMGITLAGFGAAGRAWATSYISGLKQKQLVQSGPYSICRNPLYFFSTILGIGFGFCTETLTTPLLIAFALAVLYHYQINREEARLSDLFGYEYATYVATVPRFFPSFRIYSEPDLIHISPRQFKSGLFGIASLLILIGVLQLLEGLHHSGVLPKFYQIY